jgi:serine-type D-Ala-D-Ala carboxypeptidase
VFSSPFSLIREAIRDHAFPAASIAVGRAGKLVASQAFGSFVYAEDLGNAAASSRPLGSWDTGSQPDLSPKTLFDLASVTKVVATTTMAMILYERGQFDLAAPIVSTIPEFLIDSCGELDPRRQEVTFRMLLAHSSGLPAYEKLFLNARSREDLLRAAFTMPLSASPGSRAEYSDIGFIILGAALERIAQEPLDIFCQREIFGPFAMADTTFRPSRERQEEIPPTTDEREAGGANLAPGSAGQTGASRAPEKPRSTFRRRVIQGEVQDENAFVLGGVAGHAGLFSTAEDMARFAQALLAGGSPIVRPETVELFTRRETTPAATSRALGWDTPSSPSQSGKHLGSRSYGHLGYTGTSLWIDPDRRLSIAMLTNRTWPDSSNQAIKQVRPKIHDAIVEAIVD